MNRLDRAAHFWGVNKPGWAIFRSKLSQADMVLNDDGGDAGFVNHRLTEQGLATPRSGFVGQHTRLQKTKEDIEGLEIPMLCH